MSSMMRRLLNGVATSVTRNFPLKQNSGSINQCTKAKLTPASSAKRPTGHILRGLRIMREPAPRILTLSLMKRHTCLTVGCVARGTSSIGLWSGTSGTSMIMPLSLSKAKLCETVQGTA